MTYITSSCIDSMPFVSNTTGKTKCLVKPAASNTNVIKLLDSAPSSLRYVSMQVVQVQVQCDKILRLLFAVMLWHKREEMDPDREFPSKFKRTTFDDNLGKPPLRLLEVNQAGG
ncbi:unnamed protein product [Sphenostylis stenocarpa]|uniref:Uncharacterized protein n=1 Tax=Sphenostylis stenocarpa TaxID=92480 RepID=A0AA87B6N4_9FABA|nr:unnamed protein product [Sphenostylis stenocarpa]